MLYLDSSALVKLAVHEPESDALRSRANHEHLLASEVVLAEVPRVLRRRAGDGAALLLDDALLALLPGLNLVALTRRVLLSSARIGPPHLRTLDAIHVASAIEAQDAVDAFISYDQRQLVAARAAGLAVASPR